MSLTVLGVATQATIASRYLDLEGGKVMLGCLCRTSYPGHAYSHCSSSAAFEVNRRRLRKTPERQRTPGCQFGRWL